MEQADFTFLYFENKSCCKASCHVLSELLPYVFISFYQFFQQLVMSKFSPKIDGKSKMTLNFEQRNGNLVYHGPLVQFLEFSYIFLLTLSHNYRGKVRASIKSFNKDKSLSSSLLKSLSFSA